MEWPLKCPRRCDSTTTPLTCAPFGITTLLFSCKTGSTTSPSKRSPARLLFTLMCWLMRIVRLVPAAIFTSAGLMIGAPPGAGAPTGCPAAIGSPVESTCPGAPGAVAGVFDATPGADEFGATPAAGVTVVVTASAVCPGAGGCTVVVVTLPFLSVETTCCACPVAAACFFAVSSAASCFDLQPASTTSASVMIAAAFPRC